MLFLVGVPSPESLTCSKTICSDRLLQHQQGAAGDREGFSSEDLLILTQNEIRATAMQGSREEDDRDPWVLLTSLSCGTRRGTAKVNIKLSTSPTRALQGRQLRSVHDS